MRFVGGRVQEEFVEQIRGKDPGRCLMVPVDVGSRASLRAPKSFLGSRSSKRHTTSGIAARTQIVTHDYRYIFLANRGEAPARDVTFELTGPQGEEVGGNPLRDVEDDEFPRPVLDPGTEYPLPFRLSPERDTDEAPRAHVEWDDDEGHKSRMVWLRRT